MSIVFETDGLTIKITRDGRILFPGYENLERDLVAAEAGGEQSLAVTLLRRWQFRPAEIMCHEVGLPRGVLIGLAIDWAGHVLPVFEARKHDYSPREALEMAREFVESMSAMSREDMLLFEHVADEFRLCVDVASDRTSKTVKHAAMAAYWVACCVSDGASLTAKSAKWVAVHAEGAVEDKYAERFWQIRHFVDVLKALRAGRAWPSPWKPGPQLPWEVATPSLRWGKPRRRP